MTGLTTITFLVGGTQVFLFRGGILISGRGFLLSGGIRTCGRACLSTILIGAGLVFSFSFTLRIRFITDESIVVSIISKDFSKGVELTISNSERSKC